MENYNKCNRCKKEKPSDEFKLCIICREKSRKDNKIFYDSKKLNKKCIKCGKDSINTRCINCSEKDNIFQRNLRLERKEINACMRCGNILSSLDGKFHCDFCLKIYKKTSREYYKNFKENKQCVQCGLPSLNNNVYCETCWFKSIAYINTGLRSNGSIIKQMLILQDYKCFYTGVQLKIGVNISLDHIIPISCGGEKNILNVRWVDLTVNMVKRNLTHEEFVSLCTLISKRFVSKSEDISFLNSKIANFMK